MRNQAMNDPMQIPPLRNLENRCVLIEGQRRQLRNQVNERARQLKELDSWLELAPKVDETLEALTQRLLDDLVRQLEDLMTKALREVIEQPLTLKAETAEKRGALNVEFHIERDGQTEDILRGQGGSVTNVLSVMLRFFALSTRDPAKHRRFLVLDEQDCWLRPDLVPRLLEVVQQASRELGFQVIYISHHDRATLERYCDKVYQLRPGADGVIATEESTRAMTED
jgi:hypothetical protein